MSGVSIENLYKSYEVDGGKVSVLKSMSLEVPEGQVTIILGRSGCGKTTLLRVLGGLESFEEGNIIGYGEEKPAFVFQEPRLMPWLNTTSNIAFGLKKKQYNSVEIQEMIETVGLQGFEKAYPHQLSGGMQQRVSLARALIFKPSLILMDEPFAALDYFIREQMQQELIAVQEKTGCSILFVTHSIDEALLLGHKIIIMEQGQVKKEYYIKETQRNLLDNLFLEIKRDIVKHLEEEKGE
ncbi:MAG: ABC transporter ATP-binding protein [Eubacteriales bacterium]